LIETLPTFVGILQLDLSGSYRIESSFMDTIPVHLSCLQLSEYVGDEHFLQLSTRLISLRHLVLAGTCSNISQVSSLTSLVELTLIDSWRSFDLKWGEGICHYKLGSALRSLTKLRSLRLGGRVVESEPLCKQLINATELRFLRLTQCELSDLHDLKLLTSLDHLRIWTESISHDMVDRYLPSTLHRASYDAVVPWLTCNACVHQQWITEFEPRHDKDCEYSPMASQQLQVEVNTKRQNEFNPGFALAYDSGRAVPFKDDSVERRWRHMATARMLLRSNPRVVPLPQNQHQQQQQQQQQMLPPPPFHSQYQQEPPKH